MHQISNPAAKVLYLDLKARDLLDKYGSGEHKPGSGSAAALVGIVGCKLLRTVVSMTQSRKSYTQAMPQLHLGNREVIDRIEPILTDFVQADAEAFHKVIEARRLRDRATDQKEKRRLGDTALRRQKKATDIPLLIADHCIELSVFGLTVFDLGFQGARGDSGVATHAALSAANGALFVAYLNLKDFKSGAWARRARARADAALVRADGIQSDLFKRVSGLQREGLPNPQLLMKL